MHPGLDLSVGLLADGQQLQHIAHLPPKGNILRRNLCDAFPVDLLHIDPAVERQGAHDAQLVGRVHALHVRRGIRLRQAQPLGVLQHGVVVRAFRRHPGQDIVGGSVDDTHNMLDMIGDQRTLQGVDHRDRPADAGLIVQAGPGLPRHGPQLVPVQAQGHLVGRYHGLSVFQRPQHEGGRRLLAAQEFADDFNLRILQDVGRLGGQHLFRHLFAAVDLFVQHQGFFHLQGNPRPLLQLAAEFPDQIPDAAADVAQAQQAQNDLLLRHYFLSPSVRFRS